MQISKKHRRRATAIIVMFATAYILLLIILLAVIWCFGDRLWWATLLLFAPRWPWLIPAIFTAPIHSYVKKSWWQIAAILIIAPLLLGLQLPISNAFQAKAPGAPFTVVTMNVLGGRINTKAFIHSWPESVDVVILQECNAKTIRNLIPEEWDVCGANIGVYIASRHPIQAAESFVVDDTPMPWEIGSFALRCVLQTDRGAVRVVCIHLQSPRDGFEAILAKDEGAIETLKENICDRSNRANEIRLWIDEWLRLDSAPFIIAGDFNTPVESKIHQTHWADLQNAFGSAGFGIGATKFTRWHGLRIDHILCEHSTDVLECHVGKNLGSDHRAVIAKLVFANPFPTLRATKP